MTGRVALVTGASRGVGRAIASRLAADGAAVAVNYRRDDAAAREVVDAIVAAGGVARAYRAAIGDEAQVATMLAAIAEDLGPVDLVVSNAGTASSGRTIGQTPTEEYLRLMNVHAIGPMCLVRDLLPQLRAAKRSDVIVVSSVASRFAPPASAPYTMAKAALETGLRALAWEERDNGLRANIVAPGLVATEMGRRLVSAVKGETLDELARRSPFERVATPEDIAGTVAYLVSADGAYVTGQRIEVDGGGRVPELL